MSANVRMSIEEMAQELSWASKEWDAEKIRKSIDKQLKPLATANAKFEIRMWGDTSQYPVSFSVYFREATKNSPMVGDGNISHLELVIGIVRTPDQPRLEHRQRRITLPSMEVSQELATMLFSQESPTKLF